MNGVTIEFIGAIFQGMPDSNALNFAFWAGGLITELEIFNLNDSAHRYQLTRCQQSAVMESLGDKRRQGRGFSVCYGVSQQVSLVPSACRIPWLPKVLHHPIGVVMQNYSSL